MAPRLLASEVPPRSGLKATWGLYWVIGRQEIGPHAHPYVSSPSIGRTAAKHDFGALAWTSVLRDRAANEFAVVVVVEQLERGVGL